MDYSFTRLVKITLHRGYSSFYRYSMFMIIFITRYQDVCTLDKHVGIWPCCCQSANWTCLKLPKECWVSHSDSQGQHTHTYAHTQAHMAPVSHEAILTQSHVWTLSWCQPTAEKLCQHLAASWGSLSHAHTHTDPDYFYIHQLWVVKQWAQSSSSKNVMFKVRLVSK